MSWYDDLSPCDYFGVENAPQFKAVGWLEEGRVFSRGKADLRFVHKLVLLLGESNPLEPSSDPYFCSLCAFSRGPSEFHLFQSPGMPSVPMGNRTLACPLLRTKLPNSNVPVYLVEHQPFFERDDGKGRGLYQETHHGGGKADYGDNAERFTFFSRAVLEAVDDEPADEAVGRIDLDARRARADGHAGAAQLDER